MTPGGSSGNVVINMIANATQYNNTLNQIINNTQNTFNIIIAQVNNVNQAAQAAIKQTSVSFSQAVGEISERIGTVGKAFERNITVPLMGIARASVDASNTFEISISRITGLVGIASEQTSEWAQQILVLAPQFGKSADELAQGLYFITSSGMRGAQAMDVLVQSAKASAAGLGEVRTVADAVTSAVNAYTSVALTASKATDVLVAAVREGKMEASEIAATIGRVLPIASSMGVMFEDVAGVMAVMTRTGSTARQAGVGISAFLSSILKPTVQGREALARYGLTIQELADEIQKPGGLVSAMRMVVRAFGDNKEAIGEMFGNIRALRTFWSVLAQDAKLVDDVMEKIRNSTGDLNRAFDAWNSTGAAQFIKSLQLMKTALIDIGSAIVVTMGPTLAIITNEVRGIISWFRSLDENTKSLFVTLGSIAAVVGPILIVTATAGKLVSLLSSGTLAVLALNTVVSALHVLLVTMPWAATIASITAIIYMTSGMKEALAAHNKELERSRELTDKLNEAQTKQANDRLKEAQSIEDPEKRVKALENAVKIQQDILSGKQKNITQAEKNLSEADTILNNALGYATFGMGPSGALINEAKTKLDNAKKEALVAAKNLEDTTKALEKAQEELRKEKPPTVDPQIQDSINSLNKKFEEQKDTFGMTNREIDIYHIKILKATDAQLEQTRAMAKYLDTLDKQKASTKKAESVIKDAMTPHEKFNAKVKELDEMLGLGTLSVEQYAAAYAKAKSEVEGVNKELHKFDAAASGSAEAMSRLEAWRDKMTAPRPDIEMARRRQTEVAKPLQEAIKANEKFSVGPYFDEKNKKFIGPPENHFTVPQFTPEFLGLPPGGGPRPLGGVDVASGRETRDKIVEALESIAKTNEQMAKDNRKFDIGTSTIT